MKTAYNKNKHEANGSINTQIKTCYNRPSHYQPFRSLCKWSKLMKNIEFCAKLINSKFARDHLKQQKMMLERVPDAFSPFPKRLSIAFCCCILKTTFPNWAPSLSCITLILSTEGAPYKNGTLLVFPH